MKPTYCVYWWDGSRKEGEWRKDEHEFVRLSLADQLARNYRGRGIVAVTGMLDMGTPMDPPDPAQFRRMEREANLS